MRTHLVSVGFFAFIMVFCAAPARATFHFWKVNEVYSDSSGQVQFIEFFSNSDFQEQLTESAGLKANTNPTPFVFPVNLPSNATQDKFFLVGTPGYAALANAIAPDYTLPAGQFFSFLDETITLLGASTPPLTWINQLPTNGIQSLASNLSIITNSPTNFSGQTGSVPEPSAAALSLLALGRLLHRRRRAFPC